MKKKPTAYGFEKHEQNKISEYVERICRASEPRDTNLFEAFIEDLEKIVNETITDALKNGIKARKTEKSND